MRTLEQANEATTLALRHKREQLQADMERLEQEQKVRLAALEDEQRGATQELEERRRATGSAATGSAAGGSASPPLQPVGLRVTMDETYEEVEGAEGAFAAGLKADLAAAVSASDARFEWCGVQRGSVRAMVNVLPDPTGRDARSAMALAESLVKQGSDASSSLRQRGVARTVRIIEITAPGARKQTSLQAWRSFHPDAAGTALPHPSEAAQSLERRQKELDELEQEYMRRRHNLSLMEQRLKDEEARASRPPAGDGDAAADEDADKAARRRRRAPPEAVSKVLKEMKDDIQRRLNAVLSSREAYKTERRALDHQRDSPDYAFRRAFLRQVKQAINQQAASLNADAARVKAVERSIKASRNPLDASSGFEWWNSLAGNFGRGGGTSSAWGDISDDHSDVSSNGLTSDTDTTVGSCATMNKVKHALGAAFGPAMAFQELNERARYRRAVRQREKARDAEAYSAKIHYPSRPPARSERLLEGREQRGGLRYDADPASSPRPRLSRYRSAYAAYAGAAAAGHSSWSEQHRMAVLQNQVPNISTLFNPHRYP